jgi:hypothetical protein
MTDPVRPNNGRAQPPASGGYVSSLAYRPYPLTTPGPRPRRLAELGALLAWIVQSSLRPGDTATGWEQRAGREHRRS